MVSMVPFALGENGCLIKLLRLGNLLSKPSLSIFMSLLAVSSWPCCKMSRNLTSFLDDGIYGPKVFSPMHYQIPIDYQ